MSETATLMYKDRPLRRKDNMLYYGSMSDKYYIQIQILNSEKMGDLDVATKVHFELLTTDPKVPADKRVVRKGDQPDLFAAIEICSIC